jgi:hypothetical protein
MLHDIPERFFLKTIDSKVIVVGVRIGDACIFLVLFAKQSHLKKLTDVVVMVKPSNLVIF